MTLDLTRAKELLAKTERWQLDDKLARAYDEPVGEVLWAMHKAGLIDASSNDGWWSDMTRQTDCYDAADVVALLLGTAAYEDHGGVMERGLAWNIYCHIFVENTLDEVDVLVEGMRRAPDAMRFPWAVELAAHGKLAVSALPEGTLEAICPAAVREVGHQAWYDKLKGLLPPEVHGPALCAAAAEPGVNLWNVEFLETSAAFATPDQLACMALNVDYDDCVAKMIAVLDAHPDGVEEALVRQLEAGRGVVEGYRDGPGGRYGTATAAVWAGTRALAEGRALHPTLTAALLDAADSPDRWRFLGEVFVLVDDMARERWLLDRFDESYSKPWVLAAAEPSDLVSRRVIQEVVAFDRSDLNTPSEGVHASLAAIARTRPGLLVETLAADGKLLARELLVEALAHATDRAVIPTLVGALPDSKEQVREAAVTGLVALEAYDEVVGALSSRKKAVRLAAATALAALDRPGRREAAATALAAEKTAEVRAVLEPLTAAPDAPAPLDPQALRDGVSTEHKEAFEQAWRWRSYRKKSMADLYEDLASAVGDALVAVVYDGLFSIGGKTRDKLALWHLVVQRAPVDADMAELSVRMLMGWPLEAEPGSFDDTPALHRAAVEDAWGRVHARFGDLATPAVLGALDRATGSGLTAAWRYALDHGLPDMADRLVTLVRAGDGVARLCLGLDTLGAAAVPAWLAALDDRKAEVREAAARAMEARPRADWLAPLAARRDKERSARVADAIAAAGLACASLDRPPLADDPERDARLAAWSGTLPKGCVLAKLPRLCWADGTPLSDGAFTAILSRLGAEGRDHTDPLLHALRPHLDGASARTLLTALERAYSGSKEAARGWVLFASALLADDAAMTDFGASLDDEARGGGAAVAFYKVEILRRHGSAAAFTWLDHWARNARSQGLMGHAEAALDAAAADRGTTRDALADEIVGDFGLDASGARALPYGSRTLTLAVSAEGRAVVRTDDGRELGSLPRAAAGDDKKVLAEHKRVLKALRTQVKAALDAATERLEQAMVTGRRWDRELFTRTWATHPLLRVLAEQVWWAAYDGDAVRPLRLVDGHLAGVDTLPFEWDAPVGVLHPMELTPYTRGVLEAVGLAPRFAQLARPTFAVEADEQDRKAIERYEDDRVGTGQLRTHLERRRWVRGAPQDAGHVGWFTKTFPRADLTVKVELEPGFGVSGMDYGPSEQGIPGVVFLEGQHRGGDLPWGASLVKVGQVDPIVYSEVRADLEAILGQPATT